MSSPASTGTIAHPGYSFGATCLVTALFAPLIALGGSVRRILLAIALIDIPLQIDQNFAYRDDAAELGGAGGFNVSLTTIALAGLYAAWLVDRLVSRYRSAPVPFGRLLLPLAPYVSVAMLSVVVA